MPDAAPWLPTARHAGALSVDAQRQDPASTFTLARMLIAFRRGHAALRAGSYQTVPTGHDDCLGFERRLGDDALRVFANFAPDSRLIPLTASGAELLFASESCARLEPGGLHLGPYETAVTAPRR